MGSVAAKFEKMAAALRDTAPRVDDPFWNFYANCTQAGHVRAITIPLTFTKNGQVVADAAFHCLGSPRNLMWLALHKTLAAHPRLEWDAVKINFHEHTRAHAEAMMAKEPMIAHGDYKLTTPIALMKEFAINTDGIDFNTAKPDDIRAAIEESHTRIAARICGGAFDVEWKKGGPGLFQGLRRMLGGT